MAAPRKKKALTDAEIAALNRLVGKSKPDRLRPHDVVRAARAKGHPLHGRFTWNRDKAAMAHWLDQARDIIQVYVTIINGDSKPVHAFVSLGRARDDGYIPIRTALGSAETLAELRRQFARDLARVLEQYEYLRKKLPKAFAQVETAVAGITANGPAPKLPRSHRQSAVAAG